MGPGDETQVLMLYREHFTDRTLYFLIHAYMFVNIDCYLRSMCLFFLLSASRLIAVN